MTEKNKAEEVGEALQGIGNNTMGCGCLLTILITIPFILFFL